MNANPYTPPTHTDSIVSGAFTHRAVHYCVGVASVIYAGWLTPHLYYIYRGGGLGFVKQNWGILFPMAFAAALGGLATIGVRRQRTWLPILVVWVPIAMYPVSAAIYTCWSAKWEWYGVVFLPVLLFAVAASPFAYAQGGSAGTQHFG